MKLDDLKPWMRGPFELIRHADGHRVAKGDTDRRIALIGFDNAIEVAIDVFIRLHPKIRGGVEIPRAQVEVATRTYHSKIEFLDSYVQDRKMPLRVSVEDIVWYHQLRNELYHSGNGMVPEEYVIVGARSAALAVFQALFGVDISELLLVDNTPAKEVAHRALIPSQNPEMEFLRQFIELEQEVRKLLPDDDSRPMALRHMWQRLTETNRSWSDWSPLIDELQQTRNAIVHQGHAPSARQPDQVEQHVKNILKIIHGLRSWRKR
jgi:hypothetical protein